ncbi:hypothetical protein ACWA5Z_03730 [Testudinibacter sp. P80/BLE/0925]|uniref:hypothetical protein n=1 Tax=Testudinibacter sp. TW-1 TaxID=3417757 RepID=UPI003D36E7D1
MMNKEYEKWLTEKVQKSIDNLDQGGKKYTWDEVVNLARKHYTDKVFKKTA